MVKGCIGSLLGVVDCSWQNGDNMGNWVKVWLAFIYSICVLCFVRISVDAAGYSDNNPLVIALDPGHGGEETGAEYYGLQEKNINLQMAELLKKELEQYTGVKVVLVRENDEIVTLGERARRAGEVNADILLSLHFNASVSHTSNGASIYISTGERYRKDLQKFADNLLGEFEAIGLDNAGTFARVTQLGGRRADGTFDDYYGVLRHSYNYGMPAMIIEHCFMDAEKDKQYFSTREGLQSLAKADANGIAAYYGLLDRNGNKVTAKHAKRFGATTKAIQNDYYEAPRITSIRLLNYSGSTPGLAEYEIGVEDGVGITSIYLVYLNVETEETTAISMILPAHMTTGTWKVKALIPVNMETGNYRLSYIGAYNASGYDAGYNISGNSMVGFGKCDWLNSFDYNGETQLAIKEKGKIVDVYTDALNYEIEIGKKEKHTFWPIPPHLGAARLK